MKKEDLIMKAEAEGIKLTDTAAEQIISENKLDEEELDEVAGGFAGKDKYTLQQYNKAGVAWQHNTFSKDQYFFRGVKIDQKMAEKLVEAFNNNEGKPITKLEAYNLFGLVVPY